MIPLEEKLTKIMSWEIKSKKLEQADKERVNINRDFYILYSERIQGRPNTYTAKRAKESICRLNEKLYSINPGNNFDSLVKRDIESQLKAQEAHLDYWYSDPPKIKKIEEYLDNVWGKGTWDLINHELENYDYKFTDERARLLNKIHTYSFESSEQDIREQIKEHLPFLKKMVLDYGRKKQLISKKLNFDLVLADPSCDYSCWDSAVVRMALDAERIRVYKSGKGTEIYEGDADITAFHEFVGHALRQYFSKNMPSGLRATATNSANLVSTAVDEGVAMFVERYGFRYMKRNKKSIVLSNKDIKGAEMFLKFFYQEKIFKLAHAIYESKEREDKNFEAHEELAKITKNPVFERDPFMLDDESLFERQDTLDYFVGREHVKGIMEELKKKYYSKVIEKNETIIVRGLLTGNWGRETHKDFFFSEYMKKVDKHKCLK